MLRPDDTIVAVSSPPGRSARGLLRVSGPATRTVLESLVEGDAAAIPPHTLTPCRLRLGAASPTLHAPRSTPHAVPLTLPALLCLHPAPHSYTGQDLAEMQCPGHPALLERLVQACLAGARAGHAPQVTRSVRLAEPGEFTFRAFLAGKLDLTQAEGVAATIAAASEGQLQAARLLRDGRLGRWAGDLVGALADQLALVEAGIDFTDQEDVVPVTPAALDEALGAIERRLRELLSHSRSWGALEALPRVVLGGAPSTGKSTLFNALLGANRAVISPMPGTTRDVLEEPLTLRDSAGRPVEVMLVDIAGLDDPRSALDHDIQAAARRAIKGADLLLMVDDGRGPAPASTRGVDADRVPVVYVWSKADQGESHEGGIEAAGAAGAESSKPRRMASNSGASLSPSPPTSGRIAARVCRVSAHTGQNLDALRRAIVESLGTQAVSVRADMLALQPRHESALRAAAESLAEARRLLAGQRGGRTITHVELVAGTLRRALNELECLGGRMTPDDVIGRVFATFCVGK